MKRQRRRVPRHSCEAATAGWFELSLPLRHHKLSATTKQLPESLVLSPLIWSRKVVPEVNFARMAVAGK
jgi:hypothetical protein